MTGRLDPAVADDPAARLEAAAVPTTLGDRHEVTEHWDAYGGEILHRTCSCGRGWVNDDVTVCPEAPYADDEYLGVAWPTIAELASRVERREVGEHEAAEIITACFRAAGLAGMGTEHLDEAEVAYRERDTAPASPPSLRPLARRRSAMPAEPTAPLLRRAADHLDELAKGATTKHGAWLDDHTLPGDEACVMVVTNADKGWAQILFAADWGTDADARWIAALSPVVAAPLAEWLRAAADAAESYRTDGAVGRVMRSDGQPAAYRHTAEFVERAVALARALLGEAPSA